MLWAQGEDLFKLVVSCSMPDLNYTRMAIDPAGSTSHEDYRAQCTATFRLKIYIILPHAAEVGILALFHLITNVFYLTFLLISHFYEKKCAACSTSAVEIREIWGRAGWGGGIRGNFKGLSFEKM